MFLRPNRIELACFSLQRDSAAAGLLDAVRLHVYVLLDLARRLFAVGRDQPPQVTREDIKLLEVGIGEGQDLRQERVQADIVGKLSVEIYLLLLGEIHKTLLHGRQYGV